MHVCVRLCMHVCGCGGVYCGQGKGESPTEDGVAVRRKGEQDFHAGGAQSFLSS